MRPQKRPGIPAFSTLRKGLLRYFLLLPLARLSRSVVLQITLVLLSAPESVEGVVHNLFVRESSSQHRAHKSDCKASLFCHNCDVTSPQSSVDAHKFGTLTEPTSVQLLTRGLWLKNWLFGLPFGLLLN